MPFISRPNITFCRAVSQGSSSANWNTMPRSWPQPFTSRPSTVTLPPDAVSSPMAMRNAVVLPQPGGAYDRDNLPVIHLEAYTVERLHGLHCAVDAQPELLRYVVQGHLTHATLHQRFAALFAIPVSPHFAGRKQTKPAARRGDAWRGIHSHHLPMRASASLRMSGLI